MFMFVVMAMIVIMIVMIITMIMMMVIIIHTTIPFYQLINELFTSHWRKTKLLLPGLRASHCQGVPAKPSDNCHHGRRCCRCLWLWWRLLRCLKSSFSKIFWQLPPWKALWPVDYDCDEDCHDGWNHHSQKASDNCRHGRRCGRCLWWRLSQSL